MSDATEHQIAGLKREILRAHLLNAGRSQTEAGALAEQHASQLEIDDDGNPDADKLDALVKSIAPAYDPVAAGKAMADRQKAQNANSTAFR